MKFIEHDLLYDKHMKDVSPIMSFFSNSYDMINK